MKPKNFAGRVFRRRVLALLRIERGGEGAALKHWHERFVLHSCIPGLTAARNVVLPPTDIRIRIGAKGRAS